MKKGISLIVLIITIVVIIILATAIIVNLAQTNVIKNTNIAVLKNDFQTFNEQLQLYKGEQLLNTAIKFKPDSLEVNYENILHDDEVYEEGKNIYDILTGLKVSKYNKKVYIQEGKIVIDANSFTEEQIEALKEMGIHTIGVVDEENKSQLTLTLSQINSGNGIFKITGNIIYENVEIREVKWLSGIKTKEDFETEVANDLIKETNNVYSFEVNGPGNYTVFVEASNGDVIVESIEIENVLVLYDSGDQCEDVTGGWKGYYSNGNNSTVGSTTFEDTCMKIETWGIWCSYALQTNNVIDFSNINKIYIDCVISTGTNGYATVGVEADNSNLLYQVLNTPNYEYEGIIEIDAPELQSTRLTIGAANTANIQINKIWLQIADKTDPTLSLSKEEIGDGKFKINADVTHGFSGISEIKWLEGKKIAEDFETEEATNLTLESDKKYSFVVSEDGWYTVLLKANNGKVVVSTVRPSGVIALYVNGDQCEDVTGGWTGVYSGGANSGVGSTTFEDTCMKAETWGTWCSYVLKTNNTIDLTGITKIYVDCVIYNGNSGYAQAQVVIDSSGNPVAVYDIKQANYEYTGVLEVDISELGISSSEIKIAAVNYGNIRVNAIWLK